MKRRGFLHTLATAAISGPVIGHAAQRADKPGSAPMPQRQTHSMVETPDGAKLFCRAWGAGRPVVFVHGWAVNCDLWQYQMLALSAQARCIAYDKRGHGRSSDPGRGYEYDNLADDLAAVLEQFDLRDA